MTELTHKKITIPHAGPIYAKGGVMGPIISKHNETLENIALLLQGNYPVIEHLENGEQVQLTLANFRTDFNAKNKAAKVSQEATNVNTDKSPLDKTTGVTDNPSLNVSKKDKKNKGKNSNNNVPVEDPIEKK